jgi:PKD repeat protein
VTNSNGTDTETKTNYVNVDAVPVLPVAGFSGSPLSGYAPLDVQFTDASTGYPTGWSWDFGDGATSAEQSPAHQYTVAGIYTVSLTVTNSNGTDTETKTNYITVTQPFVTASFTTDKSGGNVPLTVAFTDTSTGDPSPSSWQWNFGDGSPNVTTQSPTHTFNGTGIFTVMLTVGNGMNTSTATTTITVTSPTVTWVDASYTPDVTDGDYPLEVVFTDTSTGSPVPSSWDWNFGDGSPNVTTQSPTHTFTAAGTYTVMLTVWNSAENHDTTTATITVTAPPETWVSASFTPDKTSGTYPLAVVFTDTSTGSPAPSSWHWNFGDGAEQNGQAASYTYATAGTYTVTLTVWNTAQDMDTATATITVTAPTLSPTPTPVPRPHEAIQVGPHSELSYLYENGVLSWVVSGPLYNSTKVAYGIFYGLSNLL